jgi:hypothetical protein
MDLPSAVNDLLTGLAGLIAPYLMAVLLVFSVVALVRAFAAWRLGEDAVGSTRWKLVFMVLALVFGVLGGLIGWAPPVGTGLAGRVGAGFLVAGLAIVNRDAGVRILRLVQPAPPSPVEPPLMPVPVPVAAEPTPTVAVVVTVDPPV